MAYPWDAIMFLPLFLDSRQHLALSHLPFSHTLSGLQVSPHCSPCLLHFGRLSLRLTFYCFSAITSNLMASTKSLWESDTKFPTVTWTSSLGYSIVSLLYVFTVELTILGQKLASCPDFPLLSICCYSVQWVWNLVTVPHSSYPSHTSHSSVTKTALCVVHRVSQMCSLPLVPLLLFWFCPPTRNLLTSH